MREEVWKTVRDFSDYEVSNMGRVRRRGSEKFLKPSKHHLGGYRVNLYRNGVQRGYFIHRLVAEHFLPDYNQNRSIAFKDGNFENYRVDNLVVGDQARPGHSRDLQIEIVETGERFSSAHKVAKHIGGQSTNVLRVMYGTLKKHKGYTFRYVKV